MLSHFYTGARSSNCSSYISCAITLQLIHNSGSHDSSHSNFSQPWPDGFTNSLHVLHAGAYSYFTSVFIPRAAAHSRSTPLKAARSRSMPPTSVQARAQPAPNPFACGACGRLPLICAAAHAARSR